MLSYNMNITWSQILHVPNLKYQKLYQLARQHRLQHLDASPRWMWHISIPGHVAPRGMIPSAVTRASLTPRFWFILPALSLLTMCLVSSGPAILLSLLEVTEHHLSSPHSSNEPGDGCTTRSRTMEPQDWALYKRPRLNNPGNGRQSFLCTWK